MRSELLTIRGCAGRKIEPEILLRLLTALRSAGVLLVEALTTPRLRSAAEIASWTRTFRHMKDVKAVVTYQGAMTTEVYKALTDLCSLRLWLKVYWAVGETEAARAKRLAPKGVIIQTDESLNGTAVG